jgi:hypothetical protein
LAAPEVLPEQHPTKFVGIPPALLAAAAEVIE